jgi:hypothetical protein
VICHFVCFAPWIAYLVGPVEPVELRGIWPGQVELQRGTGGTGFDQGPPWLKSMVPPVTPAGSTKINGNSGQYHRFHRFPEDYVARRKTVAAIDLGSLS